MLAADLLSLRISSVVLMLAAAGVSLLAYGLSRKGGGGK